jgi:MFS transporter, FSR family, fosmidomycin resistance protein
MSLLDLVSSLFRPARPVLATSPSAATVAPSVSVAAGGLAVVAPGAAAEASTEPQDLSEIREPTEREKQAMLHLSNVSHACNHFQNQMLTMLLPFIMIDLNLSYADVGVFSSIRSMVTAASQGTYGFLTPFVSRCKLLGFGNFGIAIGTFLSGAATGLPMLIVARCIGSAGSSAQHPVGYSILSSYFPKARATVMAMNTSASNVGTLIATPLATLLLILMNNDWRMIFYIVAFVSLIMGAVYMLFRDYGAVNRTGSKKSRLRQGFRSYGRVIKNRNMMIMAAVFMIGAAGAENGINHTYLAPHLAQDFGYGTFIIGVLITAINIGQIAGPIILGWLSDRMNRIGVLQVSLLLSALGTLWVAWIGPGEIGLFISFVIYSAVTSSRGPLTQTIIGDIAGDQDRDAAFSLYFFLGFFAQPFWLLITGFLMDTQGFGVAVSRLAISYVVGMVLLTFVRGLNNKPTETATA